MGGDQFCLRCNGTIQEWSRPFETGKSLLKVGWCSWCITNSIHELESDNIVRRNYYKCLQCNNRTLECIKCPAMARGGFMWNDKLCCVCKGEDKRKAKAPTWETMKTKRDAICRQRDLERVVAELQRESVYREKANKEGVLRPFLLLVSMPPMLRNQISCQLGWSIFAEDYFGDSHAEAYHILNDSRSGMQARANQSYERLNPLAHNCNWYDILIRVMQSAFHHDMKHESYSISQPACQKAGSSLIQDAEVNFIVLLSRHLKAEIERNKEKQATKKHIIPVKSEKKNLSDDDVPSPEPFPLNKYNSYIPNETPFPENVAVEEEIDENVEVTDKERQVAFDVLNNIKEASENLAQKREQVLGSVEAGTAGSAVAQAMKTSADEEAISDKPTKMKETDLDESIAYIKSMILKNTGIQREEVGEYAIQLGMTCAGISKLSVSIMCLKLGAVLLPSTAGVALPAAAALSLLSTPMFIIGVFSLATGAIKLGFGSSEGRLLSPVITILNQRLLLAIEDINIDDYY